MPRNIPSPSIPSLRQTLHRANRTFNFQRPTDRDDPASTSSFTTDKPLPTLKSSRSFPNLPRPVLDRKPRSSSNNASTSNALDPFIDDDFTLPSFQLSHTHIVSTHSATTTSSSVTTDASAQNDPTLPPPNKPLFSKISGSQKLKRLSFASKPRMTSTASFGDGSSRVWASSSALFLSPRSNTDEALWSRLRPARVDKARRNRYSSHTCSSVFEISEADNLVDIDTSMLCRLPDRTHVGGGEDVFGRRRGDFRASRNDVFWRGDLGDLRDTLVSANGAVVEDDNLKGELLSRYATEHRNNIDDAQLEQGEEQEEETITTIAKAIDSSKGKLRRSANMSRAFKAVIKSGEGWVRKSEVIQATMDSDERKDPSMIILLDPSSYDATNPQVERASTTSEESASADTVASNNNTNANASLGFSTSMTPKQCAATLETLLREMSCKVSRYPETDQGPREVLRLRVIRNSHGGRRLDRKTKIMVTVREEDHIRTSVAFRRLPGLYSSRDSHIPLCTDIRDRFQREWPAVVEALYIRLPNDNPSKRQ